jgi:hypothetical protein
MFYKAILHYKKQYLRNWLTINMFLSRMLNFG